ncbi:phosphocarrier protein HPr /dihydroxyacetone kinase DhaM subunit [Glaciihabitans tibetensis]|uniref:Phosphocarrier protein HPr n=1 Tax=Glaciihabitans tibetensis TaxID=1266600 RepID=A0A2T0VE83_9MICO|nr:dihydroxyacetone kinase phosphoryl donor subunit DhaM [Glaciihabitans tibetensis]PRY68496.1 phosphocarrier protein HPr /dihydroxyacetone kinase DhaM subunit [Glaciihabitans tibetensis]
MSVGLVVVSHSAKIAEGIVELAGQMAPGVRIRAAGGTDDGGLGTSFDLVMSAVVDADDGDGVVVMCDLGSAILTAETALDFLDDELRARVRIADAPIVEGAVAAAVAAEVGGALAEVVDAAEASAAASAMTSDQNSPEEAVESTSSDRRGSDLSSTTLPPSSERPEEPIGANATLINPSGLHARPAAEFVRLASTFDARITVNGVDAKSLLRIMGMGLGIGSSVRVEATGTQAQEAVDALTTLLASGFGE